MTMKLQKAYIYVFRIQDGRSAEERLQLLVQHYCNMCGLQLDSLVAARTERGKPFFSNCQELQFSISHSGDYWICAMTDETIGVDLQEHVRLKGETEEDAVCRMKKLAHRFFHPVEAEFVALDCEKHFFCIWTARESYVKYTGQGIDDDFSKHCVIPMEKEKWTCLLKNEKTKMWQTQETCPFDMSYSKSLTPVHKVSFWQMQYKEGYTLCVCTKEKKDYIVIDMY